MGETGKNSPKQLKTKHNLVSAVKSFESPPAIEASTAKSSSKKAEETAIVDTLEALNERVASTKIPRRTVSAIVPAYNEEKTVGGVINQLSLDPLVDEIICVNDGSTDTTGEIIKNAKNVKGINLPINTGKGNALAQGIIQATGDLVLFLDGDLVNLKHEDIEAMVSPMLRGDGPRAVFGVPGNAFQSLGNRRFTGERVYRRADLTPHLEEMSQTGFGVEVYLNNLITSDDTYYVSLTDLQGLSKWQKYSYYDAIKGYVRMNAEASAEWVRIRLGRRALGRRVV